MLIYGIGTKELNAEKVYEKCTNCDAQNSTTITVIQKYAHVYWIPLFPTKKVAVSKCENCERMYNDDQFPEKLREAHSRVKLNLKTSIWTFSGTAIIVALITFLVVINKQNSAKDARLVSDPKIGDVYEIKYSSYSYSLLKVDDISRDSVFVLSHVYETDQSSGLSDLKMSGDAGYLDEGYVFSKLDLVKMYKTGEIMGVDRN